MEFEWDENKAASNLKKHKISFTEAESVFGDPLFLMFADPDHSFEEKRFIIMGESKKQNLLVVAFTARKSKTRVISARKATAAERKYYENEDR